MTHLGIATAVETTEKWLDRSLSPAHDIGQVSKLFGFVLAAEKMNNSNT